MMTPTQAHKWTDKELRTLERRIKAEYTKAYKEMFADMAAIMAKIETTPDMSLQKKMVQLRKYDRLKKMAEQLATVLQDATKTAESFISDSAVNVYRNNYNASADGLGFSLIDNTAVKKILTKEVNPFTKLSMQGITDKAALKRKLESEIITAILKGESIPNMSARLKQVAELSLRNTVRIARTETTRIENAARNEVGAEGKKMGFVMWKRWVAKDEPGVTRPAHLDANRQEVPYDEPFEVGDEKLMYPGDISLGASAGNVINCRCTMVTFIKE